MRMLVATAGLFGFLAACSTPTVSREVFLHSLTVEPNGNPHELRIVPPVAGFSLDDEWTFSKLVAGIADSDRWRTKQRVLIFIHGGLNSIEGGLERTAAAAPRIVEESGGATYPIFVNWNSGLLSGYWDHLFTYHNGEKANSFWRGLAAPFVFVADVGRALTRAPIVYWTQGSAVVDRIGGRAEGAEVPVDWRNRVRLDSREPEWSGWEQTVDVVTQFVPGFARIVTTPIIDTVGFEGYAFLERRIDTQFFTDDDLRSRTQQPGGVFHVLMDAIDPGTEIVLIGHSMGTIACNEILRRFPEHHFRHIVYMGAACTIKDFQDAVPDYLGHAIERGEDCDFYNLCLHPAADQSEVTAWSTIPNGSLLEWLDAYVLTPRSLVHRTLGKWNNAVRSLHLLARLPDAVRRRIHMKGFTVRGDDFPKTHGGFDEYRFWSPEFWNPNNTQPVGRCDCEPPGSAQQVP